jgi:putative transposase
MIGVDYWSGHGFSRAGQRCGRGPALAAEVMAIPRHRVGLPGTYFITSLTWERRSLFRSDKPCQIFVETLLLYRDCDKYQVHAFVLMPDHFHLLITPSLPTTIERAAQYIKGGSAHKIHKELGFRFPIWQRGFSDHRVRDAEDYAAHVRYIEQNPLKKGLSVRATEYPWSSAGKQFDLDEPPQRLKPVVGRGTVWHG